jgi:hypothetical protein
VCKDGVHGLGCLLKLEVWLAQHNEWGESKRATFQDWIKIDGSKKKPLSLFIVKTILIIHTSIIWGPLLLQLSHLKVALE